MNWKTGAGVALMLPIVAVGGLAFAPERSPVAAVSGSSAGAVDATGSPLAPQPYEKEVAQIVADMLQTYHYEKHPIDDEISGRWLDNYLNTLDYGRMVFLASDIAEFEKHRTTLDDEVMANPPKLDTALMIHAKYRQRMRERAEYMHGLLAKPLDLTNAESFVPDRHKAKLAWPASAAAANDLWRQRTESEMIDDLLTGRDTETEIRDRLSKRYDRMLRSLDDTESVDILELWLSALSQSYDPHSVWFKPATNDNFDIEITNSVQGIGASLKQEDEFTVVAEVIPGGPAFKDTRLKKDDRILMVAQGASEAVDVVGMRLDKVVKLIRGEKGTKVGLHLEHADGTREVIAIVRDQVMLEDSAAEVHTESLGAKKVGIVDLPSFYVDPMGRKTGRRASEDVRRALVGLQSQSVDGVILDLRHNGGGSLTEAIDVAGLFLPGGPVVQVRDRDGRIEALHDENPAVSWDGPLVVLIDATSASASEIVAGALQDYGRAVIIGDERSHGKGTVQQVAPLTRQLRGKYTDDVGGSLKLTVQKFYRVSGGSTQNKGVESDVVFQSEWDGLDVHESDLDFALAWDKIPPAPHVRTGDPSPLFAELRKRSDARRAASEGFQKLGRILDERAKLDAEPSVSLVLADRRTEYEAAKARAGLDDEADTEDAGKDEPAPTPEELEAKARAKDYVLDEAIAVLGDLIDLG